MRGNLRILAEIMELCRGAGKMGLCKGQGLCRGERGPECLEEELVCSQGVHGEGGGVRGKGGSVHASEVGARLRGPVLGMGPGSARRREAGCLASSRARWGGPLPAW